MPQLERRLAIETDPRVSESLSFHMAMLREGHYIEWHGDQPQSFMRTNLGCTITPFTLHDFDEGRLQSVIAEARANPLGQEPTLDVPWRSAFAGFRDPTAFPFGWGVCVRRH